MSYTSPLTALPTRLLTQAPFQSSLLTRRAAGGSAAGWALYHLYGETPRAPNPLTFQDPETLAVWPIQKPASKKVYPSTAVQHTLPRGDLAIFTWRDMSAILAVKTDTGWMAVPEVFAINGSLATPGDAVRNIQRLQVSPDTRDSVYLQGPDHLIEAYPDALERSLRWWVAQFAPLMVVDDARHPTFTLGAHFLPRFAPLPKKQTQERQEATRLINAACAILHASYGFERSIINVPGILLDKPDTNNSTSFYGMGGDTANVSKLREAQTWLNTLIAHPSFPLQGIDWLRPALLSPKTSNHHSALLTSMVEERLSGHAVLDATQQLHTALPGLPLFALP